MNVKVSYTVGMEEVPQVVDGILSDCKQKLIGESGKVKFSLHNLSQMFEDLNDVRETLILVEQKIQDAINMTSGWIEAQQEAEEPPPLPSEEANEQDDQGG